MKQTGRCFRRAQARILLSKRFAMTKRVIWLVPS
jgi:hypothetical protein